MMHTTEKSPQLSIQSRLSTLWIVVMLNMIFADILTFLIQLADTSKPEMFSDALAIQDIKIMMAVVALVTNVPILMVYFSRTLAESLNRKVNIGAAVFTILYVVAGGDLTPHYVVIATIEVVLLLWVIVYAWRWK
jgi:hypothetical protein